MLYVITGRTKTSVLKTLCVCCHLAISVELVSARDAEARDGSYLALVEFMMYCCHQQQTVHLNGRPNIMRSHTNFIRNIEAIKLVAKHFLIFMTCL